MFNVGHKTLFHFVNFKLNSLDGKALSRKSKFMPCKTALKAIAFYLQPPIDASIIVVLLHTHTQIIFLPYKYRRPQL